MSLPERTGRAETAPDRRRTPRPHTGSRTPGRLRLGPPGANLGQGRRAPPSSHMGGIAKIEGKKNGGLTIAFGRNGRPIPWERPSVSATIEGAVIVTFGGLRARRAGRPKGSAAAACIHRQPVRLRRRGRPAPPRPRFQVLRLTPVFSENSASTRRIVLDRKRPLDTVARNAVPFSTHFTTRLVLTRHVQDSFRRAMQEVANDRTRPRCAGPQVE